MSIIHLCESTRETTCQPNLNAALEELRNVKSTKPDTKTNSRPMDCKLKSRPRLEDQSFDQSLWPLETLVLSRSDLNNNISCRGTSQVVKSSLHTHLCRPRCLHNISEHTISKIQISAELSIRQLCESTCEK